ncbi:MULTISPECIES: hypothetical protein [Alistipes]|jgi:hypothetical protein|uniref:Uncharacterized protein n=1 Tax=Alistipes finegoldii TaxID=214856 RepID=A0AAE4RWZ6_9BACT|nr:hypothetical protein [Alistipes finegoldii]MDU0259680.1 hypothetical protein [Alistipes finegoldii]MEE0829117.1 hypothetical protein [Alistipes finegoldii]
MKYSYLWPAFEKVEVSFEDDRTLRVKGSLLGFSRSVYWQKIE